MNSVRTTIVMGLVLGVMGVVASDRCVAADETKVETLLLVGGSIHDWNGVGDLVEETLNDSGRFNVTRVNNDLDAFLPERIEPYKLVVFYWTLGELTPEQKKGYSRPHFQRERIRNVPFRSGLVPW